MELCRNASLKGNIYYKLDEYQKREKRKNLKKALDIWSAVWYSNQAHGAESAGGGAKAGKFEEIQKKP